MSNEPDPISAPPELPPEALPADPTSGGDAGEPKKLYAGKYNDPLELEKGYAELGRTLGIFPSESSPKLTGDGGLFKDHAALEAAYKTLESLHGKAKKPAAATPTGDAPKTADDLKLRAPTKTKVSGVDQIIQDVGLDPAALAEQWSSGGFDDEVYAKFEAKGYDRGFVDQMAAGQAAIAQQKASRIASFRSEAASLAGGDQNLQTLHAWAATNLDAQERKRLNQMIGDDASGYPDVVVLLKARYEKANGRGLITGDGASGPSVPRNRQEMNDLLERAQRGDQQAQRTLKGIDMDAFERTLGVRRG